MEITKMLSRGMLLRMDEHVNVVARDGGVYFDRIGKEEREVVRNWHIQTKGIGVRQKEFLYRVREALKNITEDYYIANLEPSVDKQGNLYYEVGQEVAQGYSFFEWMRMAKDFLPECGSKIATDHQYNLWIAYRIATKKWTLSEVCEIHDEEVGKNEFDVSGAKEVGGARDGVGNTQKIVLFDSSRYFVSGYCHKTKMYLPVMYFITLRQSEVSDNAGQSAVIVLNKMPTTL